MTTESAGRWTSWEPYMLATLRIVAAFIFIQTGTVKIWGVPGSIVPGGGTLPLFSLGGVAGLLETFGGALLLVGLFTRPVAFVLAGEMAFAYFIGHAPQGFWLWPVLNQGQLAVLFCFLWLYLSVAGAGAWSLDAVRTRRAAL